MRVRLELSDNFSRGIAAAVRATRHLARKLDTPAIDRADPDGDAPQVWRGDDS